MGYGTIFMDFVGTPHQQIYIHNITNSLIIRTRKSMKLSPHKPVWDLQSMKISPPGNSIIPPVACIVHIECR